MLDETDYKEPGCLLCGGGDFYNPDNQKPQGSIPIRGIVDKLDYVLNKKDYPEAERILAYWLHEAQELNDKRGELEICSEMMGLYRKTGNAEMGLNAVESGLSLINFLGLSETVSGATVALNAATTLKAFGKAEKALPIYEKTAEIYEKYLEEDDSRFGGLYNNFALALSDVGEKKRAEETFKKALSVLEQSEGNENELAITYVNLAHLYDEEGDLENTENAIETAVNYLNSDKIQHNGYHAFVLSKCIPSLDYFGFFADKSTLEKRMNEIYERT